MSHTKSDNGLDGAPFVVKTYQLVTDPGTNSVVSWSDTHDSFVVWKPVDFAAEVLPQYFKHNNFCSFIRQLNTYGFHKVEGKQWEFRHSQFKSGNPQLLKDIQRRKSKKRGSEKEDDLEHDKTPAMPVGTPASQHTSHPSPVVIDTNISVQQQHHVPVVIKTEKNEKVEELDKLKDLNQLLMREVIRLQQQQDNAQDTINRILDQLVESRKETHSLHKKIAKFTNEVSNQLPGNISLISPPASPARPEISDFDAYKQIFAAPTFTPNDKGEFSTSSSSSSNNNIINNGGIITTPTGVILGQTPGPSGTFKGEIFDMNTLDSLLSEDSYINVSDLNIDQELAKMLQHTLSPPQSPAHY